MYQPRYNTFQHFNSLTGHRFSTDYLKDIVYDEAYNCLWIAADFTNKLNCFHLETHRNEQFTLNDSQASIVGDALFALADTPQKLYVGTTSAVASLDKLTKKTDILFHEDELFTHNYNTLFIDSKQRLWFAAAEGCMAYDIKKRSFQTYRIRLDKEVRSQNFW